MYSNEGAVDPTAVKMSQMVGVFLTGLGLAAVTMRPATLDASDLIAIREDIASSIAGLKGSINTVSTSVSQTNNEVRTLTSTLNGLDVESITNAVNAVMEASHGLESGIRSIKDSLDDLDLSIDLDLTPVLDRVLSAHSAEMERMLEIINRVNALDTSTTEGWGTVQTELSALFSEKNASLVSQIEDLASQIRSLSIDVDLKPVLDATEAVRSVAEQHSANFDSFVKALVG